MLPLVFGSERTAPLKILCLGAHSDDIEIGCGGTLLRLFQERPACSVHWVVLSASSERALEARMSAGDFLTGTAEATVLVRDFRESYFPADWSAIKDSLEELRRDVNPDIIFCHHRQDLHQDHRVVAELSWNTFRNHLILEYEIPKYEGDLGRPNLFVPLSRSIADRKVELLLRHFGTQASRAWFRPDTFHGIMSVRGVECLAPEGRAEALHAFKLIV
jgi:LmbE family N-acetylglucosaminyl deacetylase